MNPRITETINRIEGAMHSLHDALALPREAARYVHGLILATRAKRAVEIGTSYGYSGLWIASALAENGGKLITIDRDARKIESARAQFEAAGLGESVDLRSGLALEELRKIDGPIDFVLNDADKENCIPYIELLADKLSDRAIVLTDNTTTHADQLARFMTWVRNREDFFSTTMLIGNGMEMSIKRGRP